MTLTEVIAQEAQKKNLYKTFVEGPSGRGGEEVQHMM